MILILLLMLDFSFAIVNLENAKYLKKINEELMPVTSHTKRWWNFFMPEDEKK